MPDLAQEVAEQLRHREEFWEGWIKDTAQSLLLISGKWERLWGSDEEKQIANFPRDVTEDVGRLFSEQIPITRVDPESERAEKRAELREKVIHGYDQASELEDSLEWFGQDFVAAGLSAIKVMPEFSQPPEKRFPTFRRVNPRFLLPEPNFAPHRPSDNVMLHYTEPISRLKAEFPEEIGRLMERVESKRLGRAYDLSRIGSPEELRVVDLYSTTSICRVALWSDEQRKTYEAEVLLETENPTGICPVQIAVRPSWTDEPKGQLADGMGQTRTLNRFWRMILDYFVEMVYGDILAWQIRNPHERGTGIVRQAMAPDAKWERAGGQNMSFQSFQVLANLEESLRTDLINPRSREGEVDLNKATAAFLSKAQGKLTSFVSSIRRQFATAKRRANEAALAQDEAWCDAKKEISGKMRGRRFRTTYTPSVDIKGEYANRVTYGTLSGVDIATNQVLQLQKHGQGLMDDETFFENDPMTEDVPVAIARLDRQAMKRSILAALQSPPGTPDSPTMAQRVEAYRAFQKGEDFDQVVEKLYELGEVPAAPLPGMGPVPTTPGIPGAEAPSLPPFASLERLTRRRR